MFCWFAVADAAPLVPIWTVGSHRTVKLDDFAFAPGLHPFGTDWIPTRLEQWTVVLDCETVADRVERCVFPASPTWSWVVDESEVLQSATLPQPPPFEVTWTKTGRLSAVDPDVDPGAFGDAAADLTLQVSYRRKDVVFKPDAKREIGAGMYGDLVRRLAAALELDLPKKGETPDGTWTLSQAPAVARRYAQGVASGVVTATSAAAPGGGTAVAVKGRIGEALPSTGGATATVDTELVGALTLDTASAVPRSARWDTRTTSTNQGLVGHTRHLVLVAPWTAGDPTAPAAMPEPAFGP